MKNRIIIAAIFIPLLFIVMFYLPPYVLAAVVALVCAVSAYELQHAIDGKKNDRISIYTVFSAVLIPVGTYFEAGAPVFMGVSLVLMCLMFVEAIIAFGTIRKITFTQILTTLFGGALIPLMLSSLISLKNMPEGRLFVLIPVISAFITDGGAYFTGVFLGKRKAFPRISPKKTVEGCVGGLVIGTASIIIYGVVLVFTTFHIVTFWALLLYGIIGAVLTELGDLAFSLVKREFNIKDYGKVLPGHGGMLDRFDSMIFAAPAIYLLVILIPAIAVR